MLERAASALAPALASALLLGCGGGDAPTTPPTDAQGSLACNAPTTIADVGSDGRIGGKWNAATQTLVFGRMQADGHFHTFLANADGSNERPLTFAGWRADRHQFPAAWHPGGQYIAMLVEKDVHNGTSTDALPGYGAYTDYWLIKRDGSQAWKLFDLPGDFDHALTHAAFSPDGSKFVWTERIGAPEPLDLNLAAGSYVFNVSDFVLAPQPALVNTRALNPGGVAQGGEVESIAADNRTIAFYSTFVTRNLFASRIYTMDVVSGATQELTTDSFAQAPTFTPDGRSLVYMTGSGNDIFPLQLQGADWWIMNVDGSSKRRLTSMNVHASPQSVGQFRLAGSISFISDTEFFGDVLTQSLGLTGKMVRVSCR